MCIFLTSVHILYDNMISEKNMKVYKLCFHGVWRSWRNEEGRNTIKKEKNNSDTKTYM